MKYKSKIYNKPVEVIKTFKENGTVVLYLCKINIDGVDREMHMRPEELEIITTL